MKFELTQVAKKALQNVVNNTLYRGKPIIEWVNFIANNADDLISRQAAKDAINEHLGVVTSGLGNNSKAKKIYKMAYNHVIDVINILPAIQPEQKTGQWIDAREQCGEFMCSNCQFFCCTNQYNYCPNCGVKIESEETK